MENNSLSKEKNKVAEIKSPQTILDKFLENYSQLFKNFTVKIHTTMMYFVQPPHPPPTFLKVLPPPQRTYESSDLQNKIKLGDGEGWKEDFL